MLPPKDNDFLDRVRDLERRVRWLKARKQKGGGGGYRQDGDIVQFDLHIDLDHWFTNFQAFFWRGNNRVWLFGEIISWTFDLGNIPIKIIIPNHTETLPPISNPGTPLPEEYRPTRDIYLPVMEIGEQTSNTLWTTKVSPDGSWRVMSMDGGPFWPQSDWEARFNLHTLSWPTT